MLVVLYFTNFYEWSNSRAIVMYHVFIMLCYVTPLFGGILADSRFGKYVVDFTVFFDDGLSVNCSDIDKS
jgi:dipeptide/tripeptide permease